MQVTETSADGLKHEMTVVVAAADIERRVTDRLSELGRTIRLPGFRPGKVPLTVLRKRYGPSVMGEVLERTVSESSTDAMRERNLRPALQPKIEIVSFNEGTDLQYKLAVEVLPQIELANLGEIQIERLKPEVPEAEIDSALERIAKQQRKAEPVDRAAEKGDIVVMDFVGSVGGVEFPGGSAKDYSLELGSSSFIPGFEDQLIGIKAGEERQVKVDFPADYGAEDLAGKAAEFKVNASAIKAMADQPIDESLATAVGMDNLAALRDVVRERIERDYSGLARQKLKRQLLDRLAERHHFTVPAGMVDIELDTIWRQYQAQLERAKQSGAEQTETPKDEAAIKAEYKDIAERRVRLGLVLAEIGSKNNLNVTQEELNRSIAEEARRFPGQERNVIEYYRNNPGAVDGLRAPIYEDKVVDFILELAQVTDKPVSLKDLLAMEDEDDETPDAGEGEAAT
ncbi:MAG TPA: trigger factor [Stellaceae bacterium]|jgi:trigger factor|nr:trigger factor [Stellaceae bacterium]